MHRRRTAFALIIAAAAVALIGARGAFAAAVHGPPHGARAHQRLSRVPAPGAHAAIVGGVAASAGSFPWLAEVVFTLPNGEAEHCSGTVVASNVVLTAGHCAVDADGQAISADSYTVYTGNVDWADGTTSAVTSVLPYPSYDPQNGYGDAALLVLATPTAAPSIALAGPQGGTPAPGTPLEIAGWGVTYPAQTTFTSELQWASVQADPAATCTSEDGAIGLTFDASAQFCVSAPPAYTAGPCHGDSGGPAIADASSATPVEVGIVSRGDPGCVTKVPSVFTRVDLVSSWAQAQIAAVAVAPPAPTTTAAAPSPPPAQAPAASQPPAAPVANPTQSAVAAPLAGRYLGRTARTRGSVEITLAGGVVRRIALSFELRCGHGTHRRVRAVRRWPAGLALLASESSWSFAVRYRDRAGTRYIVAGSFPAGGGTAATGTLVATTRGGRCASGRVRWRAARLSAAATR
jgi:secreted trypsin-like serine protease